MTNPMLARTEVLCRDLSHHRAAVLAAAPERRRTTALYARPAPRPRPKKYVGKHRGRLVLVPQLVPVGGAR